MKRSSFISIDPEKEDVRTVHHLLLGGVSPRPIAFVSTVSEEGVNNLAPFSFFNAFGANPPYVAFSPANRGTDGSQKDTLVNLKQVPECVVQVVTHSLVEQASLASATYQYEVDEFVKSGLTPLDSDIVKPKRVKESPFQMECRVEQIIPLGESNGSGNLVLCRVVKFHVTERIYQQKMIHPQDIYLVGRNSGDFYTRASGEAVFEVNKPNGAGIGLDTLPDFIKQSKIISVNGLAQLAGVQELPSQEQIDAFVQAYDEAEKKEGFVLFFQEDYKRTYSVARSLWASDPEKTHWLVEKSAKDAIKARDTEFALLALMSLQSLDHVK